QLDRRYAGYDLDPTYVDIARQRVAEAVIDGHAVVADRGEAATKVAESVLMEAGFTIRARNYRVKAAGLAVTFKAVDGVGGEWLFDVCGPRVSYRAGMSRPEVVWRALGRAHALRGALRGSA